MGEASLREQDIDALFKRVRISLHILDEPLALSTPAQEQTWTAKEVVSGKPPRRFLYHGEKARAFLVAAIPNFEQVRWSLATAMQRTRASQLANGELALAKHEAEQFFALLQFSLSAFPARTVAASSHNSPLQQRTDAYAHDTLDNVSRPKLSSVASLPAFSAHVPGERLELAVDKLDTGSWCCVYPFEIDVPEAERHLRSNTDTALMLEIRTACSKPTVSSPYDHLETISDTIDNRAAQLEDLASMLSTEILAHFPDSTPQSVLAGGPEPANECSRSDSVLARRVVQILVATHPLVNISARVVGLPAAPGATAAIVEVSVACDTAIETADTMALRSVKLRSLGWQIQEVAAPSSLPFELAPGNCWISVFKITSFADSAWKDMASQRALNLLDPDGSLAFVGHYAALTADVQIGLLDSSWVLDINHGISVSDTIQAPPTTSLSDGATYTQSDTEAETALDTSTLLAAAGTGEGSNASSGRSSGAFAPTFRLTMDMRRPAARSVSTTMGHAKTTSLDASLHSQLPQRKQSLISSLDKPLPPDIQYQPGNRARLGSKLASDRNVSAQRARAVTLNHAVGPHSPVPTIQSVASSQASDARFSLDESLQRRSSVQTAIADHVQSSDHTANILVAFNAPSKARLGQVFVVDVRLTNTSGVHFARLSLIDSPPEPQDPVTISRGLLPVNYQVTVPALPSGGSSLVKLKYTAAAPQFHSIGSLQLVDLDACADGKTLAIIEAPFVIYVDE